MRKNTMQKVVFTTTIILFIAASAANAADVAIVDYADQWTKVAALGPTLDDVKIKYDDITKDVERGSFKLTGYKLFFIGSMTTNSTVLHQNLDKNAKVIQDFVKGGGIVIEPTQADQNEANVDWLPSGLVCVRSDPDKPTVEIVKPDHPLFNKPNKFTEKEFLNWRHQGWPTVWEIIATQSGFDVLAKNANNPVIMEAQYGKGLFVMMSLAPDKYHIAGNDDYTKKQALLFFENIMETYLLSLSVELNGNLPIVWGQLK